MRATQLAALVAFAMASHASAQTAKSTASPPGSINMDLALADSIRSVLAEGFDEGHIAMLQALGHQQAIAATCSGFSIDPRAFSNEFDLVYDDAKGKPRVLDPAQRQEVERKATLAFGMAFGGQIAIASNDHEAFCKAAAQERSSGKVDHLIWSK